MSATILSIEGNIGSGKSTLIQNMKKIFNYNTVFVDEPVDEWKSITDLQGDSILMNFYKDPERWSFPFQMMAYISRLSSLRKSVKDNPGKIIITERCTHTDYNVFAKMLYDDEKITEIEYKIYMKWYNEFLTDIPIHKFIYVDAKPEKCFERVKKRNREGEENIPLEYLNLCGKYHENWLNGKKNIIRLDGNIDYNEFIPEEWLTKLRKNI